MKTKIYFLLSFFVISCLVKTLSAQSLLPPSRMEVYMIVAPDDTTNLFGDTTFAVHTKLKGKMVVNLRDTLNISKIHVKLGTTNGGSQLLNRVFVYDLRGNFNDGTSYMRNKKTLYLGLGNFVGLTNYYGEVTLEDIDGDLTTPVKYQKIN
jgi:hypothetical protein